MGLGSHGRPQAECAVLLNCSAAAWATTSQRRSSTLEGALRYIFQNPNANWWIQDGIRYCLRRPLRWCLWRQALQRERPPVLNLTTAWGVNAGYEHFWSPRWRTSLYGGYTNVEYNSQANAMLCCPARRRQRGVPAQLALANAGCDNNWTSWWIGSRTQWNVTKDFYMGLDVAYLKVAGHDLRRMAYSTGTAAIIPAATTKPLLRTLDDQDNWHGSLPRASRLLSLIA